MHEPLIYHCGPLCSFKGTPQAEERKVQGAVTHNGESICTVRARGRQVELDFHLSPALRPRRSAASGGRKSPPSFRGGRRRWGFAVDVWCAKPTCLLYPPSRCCCRLTPSTTARCCRASRSHPMRGGPWTMSLMRYVEPRQLASHPHAYVSTALL